MLKAGTSKKDGVQFSPPEECSVLVAIICSVFNRHSQQRSEATGVPGNPADKLRAKQNKKRHIKT